MGGNRPNRAQGHADWGEAAYDRRRAIRFAPALHGMPSTAAPGSCCDLVGSGTLRSGRAGGGARMTSISPMDIMSVFYDTLQIVGGVVGAAILGITPVDIWHR